MAKRTQPAAPAPAAPLPVTPEEFLNLADASACVVGAFSDLALKDPAALAMVLAEGLDGHGFGEPWAPSLRRCVLALQRLAGLPANAGSVYELALALGEAGDWPQAERAARAALRILPNHDGQSWPMPATVGGFLARALLEQGRREEARAVALESRAASSGALDGEAAYEVLAELLDAGELAKLYPPAERKAPAAASPARPRLDAESAPIGDDLALPMIRAILKGKPCLRLSLQVLEPLWSYLPKVDRRSIMAVALASYRQTGDAGGHADFVASNTIENPALEAVRYESGYIEACRTRFPSHLLLMGYDEWAVAFDADAERLASLYGRRLHKIDGHPAVIAHTLHVPALVSNLLHDRISVATCGEDSPAFEGLKAWDTQAEGAAKGGGL